MKMHKEQIYNENSPKRPNTKCLLHPRWNVYPERSREVTSKDATQERLARCPCMWAMSLGGERWDTKQNT